MRARPLHRFEHAGKRYVIDPETCFCFECDAVSWDVLEHFPEAPVNRVFHLLEGKYPHKELEEVIGELEWLRASKSILTPPRIEQQHKAFEIERGLRRLVVSLEASAAGARRRGGWFVRGRGAAAGEKEAEAGPAMLILRAAQLLLARGAAGAPLRLDLRWNGPVSDADAAAEALREVFGLAELAGKTLHLAVGVTVPGREALEGATATFGALCTRAEHLAGALAAVRQAAAGPRAAGKALKELPEGVQGEALLAPAGPRFAGAVKALHAAGFHAIEIDLDALYTAAPGTEPRAVAEELRACAQDYAAALLQGEHYRLEPIAGLFHRIFTGTPVRRTDPSGLSLLAVDAAGDLYPSTAFFGQKAHVLGNLHAQQIDAAALARHEDTGAATTADCLRCWARNLCGGGAAAIHLARSGDFRTPDPAWCDAQRQWLQTAIAAFNLLSAQGVNFTRVYGQLGRAARPSLFTMVKAAFQANIGLRPLGEGDAELLAKWQNFNDAAYFTFNETGLLMATRYDREMDALYPKGYEFEFLLLRRNGAPMGLLRVRPLPAPGAAMAWIYLRNAADYGDAGTVKSLRFLLGEAGKAQGLQRLVVPCGPFDAGLGDLLRGAGFTPAGAQREALYLRGKYHDVTWFEAALA